jgi:hypothetical protein
MRRQDINVGDEVAVGTNYLKRGVIVDTRPYKEGTWRSGHRLAHSSESKHGVAVAFPLKARTPEGEEVTIWRPEVVQLREIRMPWEQHRLERERAAERQRQAQIARHQAEVQRAEREGNLQNLLLDLGEPNGAVLKLDQYGTIRMPVDVFERVLALAGAAV